MNASFRHILIAVLSMMCAFSCRYVDSILHDGDIVAKVGDKVLLRSELDAVIPDGISSADSTRLAMQYINSWATDMLYLNMAESQLSKEDLDVSKELEEYRRALLKFRYEHKYVNERLDTLVSPDEVEAYYKDHQGDFVLSKPIVKVRLMKITSTTPKPEITRAKTLLASFDLDAGWSVDESEEAPTAGQMTTYDNAWVDLDVVIADMGTDPKKFVPLRSGTHYEYTDENGFLNIAYVVDKLEAGAKAPLEHCSDEIRDIIVSSRKHKLTKSLEQQLLEDARARGNFVIY